MRSFSVDFPGVGGGTTHVAMATNAGSCGRASGSDRGSKSDSSAGANKAFFFSPHGDPVAAMAAEGTSCAYVQPHCRQRDVDPPSAAAAEEKGARFLTTGHGGWFRDSGTLLN